MGSRGSRSRKPAHHLPKVRDSELPTASDLMPPNIMWPEQGSGFEADPFSPAGTAQRQWWLINRLGRRRGTRWIIWLSLAWVLGGVAFYAVSLVREMIR
jgi:hypothetical protein